MGVFDFIKHAKGGAGAADTGGEAPGEHGESGAALAETVKEKLEDLAQSPSAARHAEQGLGMAGKLVDEKTGHKYTGQINTGVTKGRQFLEKHAQAEEAKGQAPPETGQDPQNGPPSGN